MIYPTLFKVQIIPSCWKITLSSSPEWGMLVTVFPNITKILNLNETWLSFFLAFDKEHGKTMSEDALGP